MCSYLNTSKLQDGQKRGKALLFVFGDRETEPRDRFVVVLQKAGYTTIRFRKRVIVGSIADHGVTERFVLDSHIQEIRLEKVTAIALQGIVMV
jgi:hypothetical protein